MSRREFPGCFLIQISTATKRLPPHYQSEFALYTVLVVNCLFCKIIEGRIPSTEVYQDDQCYAFGDIDPKAPVHVLIVPREHIASLADAGEHHPALLGHLLWTAAKIARDKGLSKGYRIVINTGQDSGQSVDHIHVHLLGGRALAWPPG